MDWIYFTNKWHLAHNGAYSESKEEVERHQGVQVVVLPWRSSVNISRILVVIIQYRLSRVCYAKQGSGDGDA